MKKIVVCSVLIAVALFAACGGNKEPQPKNDSANQNVTGGSTDGKALFDANCQSCHGADGKAGVAGAADLSVSKLDHETMKVIVKSGRNMMRGFEGRLNDSEIDVVTRYAETLRK
jgi:mono/diheme cytochrome c family protein